MTRYRIPGGRLAGRALILAGVLGAGALGGCAPQPGETVQLASLSAPAPASPTTPQFTAAGFRTADGEVLPARKWLPQGQVKAVILALHGMNDYSNAFAIPAAEWAAQGIATYAYDQRGFGAARERGQWAGQAALVADAVAAATALREAYPQLPLYLLGESMGGAVAAVAMTGEGGAPIPPVDGVILSAPAVWSRATMPLSARVALWAGDTLFPSLTLTGERLHVMPSDNLPMLRALSRDPMVIKETRIDAIHGLVDLMDAAMAAAPALHGRLLLMYGAHDEIVPREPIRDFVAALPASGARVSRLAYYPFGYHMLLRDLDGAMVARDVASWAIERGGLPSGADRADGGEPSWPPHGRRG
jgi:acylglycerol lipase